MTRDEVQRFAPQADIGKGAAEADIAAAEQALSFQFPAQYREFLATCDGLCGFIGPHYLILQSAAALLEYNRGYGFFELCPQAIAIGSDGGGEAVIIRRDNGHFAFLDFNSLSLDDAVDVAPTFDEFIRSPNPPGWA